MDKKIFVGLVAVLLILLGFIGYDKYFIGKNTGTANQASNQTTDQTVVSGGTIPVVSVSPAANVSVSQGLTLTVSQPADNTTVGNSTITVAGKTVPGADVFVNDKQLKADVSGNFITQVTLDEGQNIIVVSANDASGNYAEKDLTVSLESTQ